MKRSHVSSMVSRIVFLSGVALFTWIFGSIGLLPQAQAQFPEKVFAPYVDVLLYPRFSLKNAYEATGQTHFTLAFVVSGSGSNPTWGGVIPMADNHYAEDIAFIRSVWGDVIVSFGGANGVELAMACTDETELQAPYQSVIDRYGLRWVDFDIEGAAVGDRVSIDRRNRVIRRLQDANPGLKVAFCLPVLPQGLTHDGLYVIENAEKYGVSIDVVNVMAMDYGDWAAPDPDGQMGQYAIEAGLNTLRQCQTLGIETTIGITPMIGQNDVSSEVFYLSDAAQLVSWAGSQDMVRLLSFWSMGRDNGDCPGHPWASPLCSGLEQGNFAFTEAFANFASGGGGNISPVVQIVRPEKESVFLTGESIDVAAAAPGPDGRIASVSFYQDGGYLGTDSEAPYGITLNDLQPGRYAITAVAADNEDARTASKAVSITIVGAYGCTAPAWDSRTVYLGGARVSHGGFEWQAKWWTLGEAPGTTGHWGVWKELGPCHGGNQPPQITITDPSDGALFQEGESILITADATDPDGSISHITFFAGADSLGQLASPPYRILWQPASPGPYIITAVAVDNEAAETRSGPVNIRVQSEIGGCSGLPDFPAGRGSYEGGAQVQNEGHVYECRPWPYAGWCNVDNSAYEPGVGWAWQDAWIYVGVCED